MDDNLTKVYLGGRQTKSIEQKFSLIPITIHISNKKFKKNAKKIELNVEFIFSTVIQTTILLFLIYGKTKIAVLRDFYTLMAFREHS